MSAAAKATIGSILLRRDPALDGNAAHVQPGAGAQHGALHSTGVQGPRVRGPRESDSARDCWESHPHAPIPHHKILQTTYHNTTIAHLQMRGPAVDT
eukprot:7002133-Pyramimonas_sp.AAC.1